MYLHRALTRLCETIYIFLCVYIIIYIYIYLSGQKRGMTELERILAGHIDW